MPANVGFIFALLAFAAGFAVRPFGALIFGRLGDMIGRKYTFLITMSLMGIGTFFIGVLPGYATWGILAPVVLIALRLVQGLALGGEYGGAAIYVAEHAPKNKRGFYTSWIQTTATLGLFMALLLILGIRTAMGEAAFGDWGWRIPFLLSAILLAVSIWIRLKLNESPLFKKMVEEGKQSKRPLSEAFGQWSNAKIAIAGAARRHRRRSGGVVRRTVLRAVLPHPDAEGAGGHRADHDRGRRSRSARRASSCSAGCRTRSAASRSCSRALRWRSITYFPIFQGITHFANPKLEAALAGGAGGRHRRSGRVLVPVQGDGHREVHHRLRHHQVGAGRPVGELRQRRRAGRHARRA